MTICLATYEPLVFTGTGKKTYKTTGLPPFVDGSCRREPDFEHEYPSITDMCRTNHFATSRKEGHIIIYLTREKLVSFPSRSFLLVRGASLWAEIEVPSLPDFFEDALALGGLPGDLAWGNWLRSES